ncbi:hypothetical protein SESBI_47676 [Sesbania bispinosa]|nr:hypothetical protein SESBI_47676 [Sesbania bispinosa]
MQNPDGEFRQTRGRHGISGRYLLEKILVEFIANSEGGEDGDGEERERECEREDVAVGAGACTSHHRQFPAAGGDVAKRRRVGEEWGPQGRECEDVRVRKWIGDEEHRRHGYGI